MAPSLSRTGLRQAREREEKEKKRKEEEKKKKEEEAPLKILVGDVRARIAQALYFHLRVSLSLQIAW